MKISEAQTIYRQHRQELTDRTRSLIRQRDEAQSRFQATGSKEFSDLAATLQLSIDETQDAFDKNQEVLDALTEQYAAVWNAEVERQQSEAGREMAVELAKIMTVARRISHGDIVPYSDEKKLLEYNVKLYQIAKNAAMMRQAQKPKKYDSLWDDEDKPKNEYDPEGKADNAEVNMPLPSIEEFSPMEGIPADAAGESPAQI